MTFWEWAFIYEKLKQYGYAPPLLDVGGYRYCSMADAEGLSGYTGLVLPPAKGIWAGVSNSWDITHTVEEFAIDGGKAEQYGTIVSTSTLEHAENPFTFMYSVNELLRDGGLAIIVTVFMWSVHGDYGTDFWRFTPSGLEELAKVAKMNCIETGMKELNPMRRHSYIVCSKGMLGDNRKHDIEVPAVIPEDKNA